MKVLIACEFSGIVREAFRKLGHDAWSLDLLPAADNSLHHIQDDATHILSTNYAATNWDLCIAHPPCTYLTISGARWFDERRAEQQAAIDFFMLFVNSSIPRIAIENPIGVISTHWRKPDQIIQPWQFGHGEIKATCLWLKNLPPLTPTNIVSGRAPRVHYESPGIINGLTRQQRRSVTLQGIADAMAQQWSEKTPVKTIDFYSTKPYTLNSSTNYTRKVNTMPETKTPTITVDFTEHQQVSRELLKLNVGTVYFLKVLGEIHEMQGEKARRKNPDGTAQKAMELMNAFNYADQKQYQVIVNHVLGNTLRESFPADSYIGLTFRVEPLEVKTGRGGNRYNPFNIVKGEVKGVKTPDAVFPVKDAPAAPAQDAANAGLHIAAAPAQDAPAAIDAIIAAGQDAAPAHTNGAAQAETPAPAKTDAPAPQLQAAATSDRIAAAKPAGKPAPTAARK